MIDWILSQPFWIAVIALTAVAAVRSQCTYWLGRAVRAGVLRGKWATRFENDRVNGAITKLERWGWPLIPLSFFTVGFQTAVHLAAGLVGWSWLKYTLASIPGWISWGVVYSAGGLAVFAGAFALAAKSPWLAALVLVLVVGVIALVMVQRRRKREASEGQPVEVEMTA